VGRRNYRYFFAFVATGTLMGFFLTFASLGHCLAYKRQMGVTFAQSINHWRTPFAMFIYGILATPYPTSLFGYHLFLMGRGETTREYLNSHKFAKVDRHRPFTQGNLIKNWLAVLGRPKPPTYLHFKRQYEEGDQRFGSRRGRQAKDGGGDGDGLEMKPVSKLRKTFEGPASRRSGKDKG
jgi:palmitoyltransferase ZDHHC9/14/18